jgi:hypothetical protein
VLSRPCGLYPISLTRLHRRGCACLLADRTRRISRIGSIFVFRRKKRVQFDKVCVVVVCEASVLLSVLFRSPPDTNHVNPSSHFCFTYRYHLFLTSWLRVTQKVVASVFQGVTTTEHDASSLVFWLLCALPQNLASETAAYLATRHPDYAILAARIAISNLHKETKKKISQVIKDLCNYGQC